MRLVLGLDAPTRGDAQALPYASESFDVLLIAEAIYYLPDVDAFLREAARVLRHGGRLLIVTANKDLYDFHKSPGTHSYFGVVELRDILRKHGFDATVFGDISTSSVPWRQRLLRQRLEITHIEYIRGAELLC